VTFTNPAAFAGPPPKVKARQHSRLVRTLRWALPLAMVAVIGALAGLIGAHALKRQANHHEPVTQIKMTNPHFFGRDTQGRAYMLTSRQAARDEQDINKVLLQFPQVSLDVDGAHPSTLTADTGVYQEDTRILLLNGHVRADDSKATSFASDTAIVNTRTGTVTGPSAIAGQTAMGNVRSNSYDVYDKGNRVIYKGGVHARLNQH
jgi:lipopolysaccharide export system protein LptC